MSSFWSLVLVPGKKYEKEVVSGIFITKAVLDTSSGESGIVQVVLEFGETESIIANLSIKHGILQTTLDLAFSAGDLISFTTNGAKVSVHLTGMTGDLDDDDDSDLEFDDDSTMESTMDENKEDSDEEPAQLVAAGIKRKATALKSGKPSKMPKKDNTLNGKSFGSSDESDDESYNPIGDLTNGDDLNLLDGDEDLSDADDMGEEEEVEEEEGEDDEDMGEAMGEEEEDDELELEEEEEEEVEVEVKKAILQKSGLLNGGAEQKAKQGGESPKKKKKKDKQLLKESPKAQKTEVKTPVKDVRTVKTDKTPKSEKKGAEGKALAKVEQEGSVLKTPKKDKKNKEGKTPKGEDQGKKVKTPKSEKKKMDSTVNGQTVKPSKQMRAGGVMVEDTSVGIGVEAKHGSFVSVYYEGRLTSNKKVFDKTVTGPPFKFRLGRGEVIKGWDVGVMGMKVGGKRKITIPPNMGYGKKGAQPDIPGNAFLDFEVTLTKIN